MAKKDEIIEKLRSMLPEESICVDEAYQSGVALSAQVPVGRLRDAANACEASGLYLESITGLDFQDTAELVYHLNFYEPKSRIALRILLALDQKALPTVSDIFPAALWLEREVHEFFGILFTDHPDLRPLLLPEDADYHPLRKTFGKVNAYRERKAIYGGDSERSEVSGDQMGGG
jgi:NADH-quinone oxidoreductase subunit C